VRGVERHQDVLAVGDVEEPLDLCRRLDAGVDVRVKAQLDADVGRGPADPLQSNRESVDVGGVLWLAPSRTSVDEEMPPPGRKGW
jgi:hypothetical protein